MKTAMIAATVAGLLASGGAFAADVSGAWKITGDIVGNAVETVCTFAPASGKTTATCTADGKPGKPADVTVADKAVTWDWDAGQAVLTFKGTLDSDKSMKGDIETSGVTGSFTAAKQ